MLLAFEAATVLIDILYISIYLRSLYQNGETKPYRALTLYMGTGFALLLIGLINLPLPLHLAIMFVIVVVLTKLLFKAKWRPVISSSLLLIAIMIVSCTVALCIFKSFRISQPSLYDYGNTEIMFIVVSKIIQTFLIFLAAKLAQLKKSQESLLAAMPLLLCQVFSIFICYIMYFGALKDAHQITASFVVGSVGILYINVIIYLYVERIKRVSEIKKQNELAEQQFRAKLDYFNQVKEDQEETRALWHDIKNYMNTMQKLIVMDDKASAKDCIEQVTELFSNTGNIVDVGNTVVSAVLNHGVQKARHNDIDVSLDIRVKEELNISAADLSVIVGNTFDNAIEACTALGGKGNKISIQLVQKDELLFYEIINPYDPKLADRATGKTVQGYGLKNVQRCIDKYQGNITVNTSESEYRVTVIISIAKI